MDHLNKKLLIALLDLAQTDVHASVTTLARHLGVTRKEVARGLSDLAELGWVRPETVRLTFVGLMKAAGLRARLRARASQRDVAA